ncbi:hypothetical protein GE09DRAFT_315852 [Coniochaeta sp. 2T2.1]|nr:hypothetical protein GE09DRAFT_315852 [Coniochaeta sp. 2T2.1]
MASLKFIMDVDDDQPEPHRARGEGQGFAHTIPPPHNNPGQVATGQPYASHVIGPDLLSRHSSNSSIGPAAGSRRAAASARSSNAPAALTTTSRLPNRRRSTASNESLDQASYSSSSVGGGLNLSNSPMRPMPGSSTSDMPVKYTPITGRVSRARKGVPVHICEICRPPKTFTRAEHLRRHQLSHQTPGYPCTHPSCDRAFHRPDLLARHQARHAESGEDDTSAVAVGGEDDGQPSLVGRASHLDLSNQTASSSNRSGGQAMPSGPSAPSSEAPSTPNPQMHATNLQPGISSETSPSPGEMPGRGGDYGFQSQRYNDGQYSTAPGFSVIRPSSNVNSSMSRGSYSAVVDSFQQPRTTPSVFATQGVSLPSLSIPDNNPPDLYHPGPDASPWASSASDSTYSTPVSDNARNPRFWLGRHRSPTSDWPSNTHLLAPYPNPTSRNPSRGGSLDSISAAPAPAIFANPFQASQFSAVAPQDPNYGTMLDVPMAGFGTAEHGGGMISSPSPSLTFRPHHRHSTSLSSMRTAAPHTSAALITSMPAIPDRTTVINTLNRQKEHLVNMTNSHETFMSGGLGFNILGEFGAGFGDVSPGGTGLLAALDLPMTGCGMPGIVLSSQQLPRQVLSAVPNYIEVYWQFFHKLYPIVHRPSFESAGEDVLRCAMAAIATQFLDTKEDRLRGNQLHEHAWQELKRVSEDIPQWNIQVMQAILLCEVFARFRGRKAVTRPSKMFESLYSRVLYHNPTLFDPAIFSADPNFQSHERWHAWLDAEARRRLLTACFITDVHTAAYQQQRRAHECDFTTEDVSPTIPLTARSAALWEASSALCWATNLAADPEAGIPAFAHSLDDDLTPADLQRYPFFDEHAVLALELVHLPPILSNANITLPHPDDDDNLNLDPLIRPKSTPGYSTTTSPTSTTLQNLVFPLSCPLTTPHPTALDIRSRTTVPSKRKVESRISSLFPTNPRAATYLALHHTPLHDLLAVSGDTWIFSQKVLPATSFLEHQRRLKQWAEEANANHGWNPSNPNPNPAEDGLSAAKATIYAARAIISFLSRAGGVDDDDDDDDESPMTATNVRSEPGRWMVDISDYWGVYVCALICWAFGHRAREGGDRERRRGGGSGSGGEEQRGRNVVGGGGSAGGRGDADAMAWLRMVSAMGPEQVARVRGRKDASSVVGLVRRRLEWDCVGGRSRLYVDAVGVLKKLEEGVDWKWF